MRSLHLLSLCLLTSFASADQLCFTVNAPLAATSWNTTVNVPRFDPASGSLNFVTVELTGNIQGEARLESTAPHPLNITTYFQANVQVSRPDNTQLVAVLPVQSFFDALGPFDGVVDYRGVSGFTHLGIVASAM